MLPVLAVGERIDKDGTRVRLAGLDAKAHETNPPARYTEASLIKELERIGVGRPSTFAATIGTIERRGYVFRQGKALVPSFTAFAVTHLLRGHFSDLVDVAFTAEMEEDLDEISRGEREWLDFIRQFYRGDSHHRGLEEAVKQAEERAEYPLIDVGADPESGEMIRVRIGRYGPFLQQGESGPGKTAGVPPTIAPADLSVAKAMAYIRAKAEGPRLLGVDAKTGMNVFAINGRFGAYVQLGETPEKGVKEKPRRSSLTGALTESTVTLEDALKLLELPRELGTHAESGQPVVAGLGRFGPCIKHGDDYRSLEPTDDPFTVDLERRSCCWRAEALGARSGQARHPHHRGAGWHRCRCSRRAGPYVTDGERTPRSRRGRSGHAVARRGARCSKRVVARRRRRGAAAAPPPARARPPPCRAAGRRRRGAGAAGQIEGQGQSHTEAAGPAQGRGSKVDGPQAGVLMGVRIVGGGLAGSEAAWQAASRGVRVTLHEMRPVRPTAVHKTDRLAELVCSNSFAATSSITRLACSRKKCGASARS